MIKDFEKKISDLIKNNESKILQIRQENTSFAHEKNIAIKLGFEDSMISLNRKIEENSSRIRFIININNKLKELIANEVKESKNLSERVIHQKQFI